jgi:hypothetical protein
MQHLGRFGIGFKVTFWMHTQGKECPASLNQRFDRYTLHLGPMWDGFQGCFSEAVPSTRNSTICQGNATLAADLE